MVSGCSGDGVWLGKYLCLTDSGGWLFIEVYVWWTELEKEQHANYE